MMINHNAIESKVYIPGQLDTLNTFRNVLGLHLIKRSTDEEFESFDKAFKGFSETNFECYRTKQGQVELQALAKFSLKALLPDTSWQFFCTLQGSH